MNTTDAARKRLAAKAQEIDTALTKLTVELARAIVTPEDYETARDELHADRIKIGAALEQLAATSVRPTEPPLQIAATLCEKWQVMPTHVKRTMLAQLIRRIEVTSLGRGKAKIAVVSAWGEVYFYDI
jgi:hypothetical protein